MTHPKDTRKDGYLMIMQGKTVTRDGRKWTEIPFTTYGDYVGTTVERANNEVLLKTFPHERFHISAWERDEERAFCYEKHTPLSIKEDTRIIEVTFDYWGSTLYRLESDEELKEIADSLEDDPCFDDGYLSMLEWILFKEYVQDEIVHEFIRTNVFKVDVYCDINDMTETAFEELVSEKAWDYIYEEGLWPLFEQATCAYLRETDDVLKYVEETIFTSDFLEAYEKEEEKL
jgi:hypothetical protein